MNSTIQSLKLRFVQEIFQGVSCHNNLMVLSGDVQGLFPSTVESNYVSLETVIIEHLRNTYTVVALDMVGLDFTNPADQSELPSLLYDDPDIRSRPLAKKAEERFIERLASTKYAPLSAMALLREIMYAKVKRSGETKPLCVLIRHAGALFPARELGSLDQQDRQRLVFFLNWITSDDLQRSSNLFLLVEGSRSEINQAITGSPLCRHIQLQLPNEEERLNFMRSNGKKFRPELLDTSLEQFAAATAGLPLTQLEDLVEVASAENRKVTGKDVVSAVNTALQGLLGNIVTFKPADHTLADVIGYDAVKQVLLEALADCDDPETAVPGFLVSGPNGVGKTWIMEALANDSGWVVIELSGLRDSEFGATEKLFEQFRMVAKTFGRILVNVDEAHTAFSSIHSSQSHEVEKRLSGNVVKMMGDPGNHGKILWSLMTSRPDELDPDILSRLCSVQVPIFDLEGEDRKQYIKELFARKRIELSNEELVQVVETTKHYSNRDLSFFLKSYIGRRKRNPELKIVDMLKMWRAGDSIQRKRRFQELLALQHCTYPNLIPERFKNNKELDSSETS